MGLGWVHVASAAWTTDNLSPCQEPCAPGDQGQALFGGPIDDAPVTGFVAPPCVVKRIFSNGVIAQLKRREVIPCNKKVVFIHMLKIGQKWTKIG